MKLATNYKLQPASQPLKRTCTIKFHTKNPKWYYSNKTIQRTITHTQWEKIHLFHSQSCDRVHNLPVSLIPVKQHLNSDDTSTEITIS